MNKLKYSYTTFKTTDVYLNTILDKDSIDLIDNVDIRIVPNKEELFNKYIKQLMREMWHINEPPRHWIFKDSVLIDKIDDDLSLYYFFDISNWDPRDKKAEIDSRTLTISIYSFYSDNDEIYKTGFMKYPDGSFNHISTYRIKVEHAIQMYINFRRYLRNKNSPIYTIDDIDKDTINLFIEPVYLNKGEYKRFIRLSNYYYGKRHTEVEELRKDFINIKNALERFLFLQQFAYYNINNRKTIQVRSDNKKKYKNVTNIRTYAMKTDGNRFMIINIDNVVLRIKPKNNNVYTDKESKEIGSIHRYRYQVVGYERRQWKGSRKDGTWHQEVIWVDSYYRGFDKDYSISKNYTNKEI